MQSMFAGDCLKYRRGITILETLELILRNFNRILNLCVQHSVPFAL